MLCEIEGEGYLEVKAPHCFVLRQRGWSACLVGPGGRGVGLRAIKGVMVGPAMCDGAGLRSCKCLGKGRA